jgi:predicted transposase/invertase (TIGR01784 family)
MQKGIEMNEKEKTENVEIKYPFSDQLVFAIVMRDEHACRELLSRLFPDRVIKEIRFPDDDEESPGGTVETEKTIINGIYYKSIRVDVLFEADDTWTDIEMQVERDPHLPKRIRYYHASMDTHHLKKGKKYEALKPSYVIFICRFDYFGLGEAVYRFEAYDAEKSLPLGDGSYTIVLNTRCPLEKVPKELRSLYAYIDKGKTDGKDDFINYLDDKVKALNGEKEMTKVMTLEEDYQARCRIARKEGLAQGRAEGEEIGLAKGEEIGLAKGEEIGLAKGEEIGLAKGEEAGLEKLTELNRRLIADNRMDDLIRSTEDSAFQAQLLAEYGLNSDAEVQKS